VSERNSPARYGGVVTYEMATYTFTTSYFLSGVNAASAQLVVSLDPPGDSTTPYGYCVNGHDVVSIVDATATITVAPLPSTVAQPLVSVAFVGTPTPSRASISNLGATGTAGLQAQVTFSGTPGLNPVLRGPPQAGADPYLAVNVTCPTDLSAHQVATLVVVIKVSASVQSNESARTNALPDLGTQ
jgi:hypothetical protein